jgi:hypothetical protein
MEFIGGNERLKIKTRIVVIEMDTDFAEIAVGTNGKGVGLVRK